MKASIITSTCQILKTFFLLPSRHFAPSSSFAFKLGAVVRAEACIGSFVSIPEVVVQMLKGLMDNFHVKPLLLKNKSGANIMREAFTGLLLNEICKMIKYFITGR